MPRMSSSGGRLGQGRGEGQRDVAFDADPHAAGMVDRQCDTRPVGGLGGRGQRLDRAGPADRRRRRLGDLGQRSAADPLRDHQPARAGADHVEHPCDAGHVQAAELEGARQDLPHLLVGQRRVRVDERQRDLAVQRGVEGLPELQVRRAAVEDQQPVAAAADGGARNEVDVLVGRWRTRSEVPAAVRMRSARGWDRRRSRQAGGRRPASAPSRSRARGRLRSPGTLGSPVCDVRRCRWACPGRSHRPTGAGSWSWRCCQGPVRRRPLGRRSPLVPSHPVPGNAARRPAPGRRRELTMA